MKLLILLLLVSCETTYNPKLDGNVDEMLSKEDTKKFYACIDREGDRLECYCQALHDKKSNEYEICVSDL